MIDREIDTVEQAPYDKSIAKAEHDRPATHQQETNARPYDAAHRTRVAPLPGDIGNTGADAAQLNRGDRDRRGLRDRRCWVRGRLAVADYSRSRAAAYSLYKVPRHKVGRIVGAVGVAMVRWAGYLSSFHLGNFENVTECRCRTRLPCR